jgi:hypothetical protein
MRTLDELRKMGFTLIEHENDGIENVEMMTSDVVRSILAFEAPRSITEYLGQHNVKKTFEFIAGKLKSDDSRRLLRMLTEDNPVSELVYR